MEHEKLTELQKISNNEKEKVFSEKDEFYSDERLPIRRQFLMSFGTFMLTIGAGMVTGFSAILIPQLQSENKTQIYSTEMISWVAAMASFALFFGNLLSGYLMERFGRRASQLMLTVCFTIGWNIIGFASNVYFILLGRFITGLGQGWLGPLGPVFVGEISSPTYRGFLLAALSLAVALGVFLSHLFGTFLHWKYASLLCALFPLTGGIILYYAPESPAWLAAQNRIDESVTSFQWYRGRSPDTKAELDKIIYVQTMRDVSTSKFATLKNNIKKPEFWKPLIIMSVFFVMTQLSGVNVISAYTMEMMKELIGNNVNAYTAMLAIDILRCVSLSVACILLKARGRRPMAMISGVLTSLSMITLAIYLYFKNGQISPIITLGLITMYMIVSNLGVVPLPWNMVGELFATETKGLGSGISVMMTSLAYFATIKTAPGMFETIGHHGTYLFYGISTLVGTLYLFFYLPETKGKTLLQIEEYFKYGNKGKPKELTDEMHETCANQV